MKPKEQRIAIAEACGLAPRGWNAIFSPSGIDIPDYLYDLNAMHEAEKVLKNEQYSLVWADYLDHLARISVSNCCHATAAQRAEAFLRTLDLWK